MGLVSDPAPEPARARLVPLLRRVLGVAAVLAVVVMVCHGVLLLRLVPRFVLDRIPFDPADCVRPEETEVTDRFGVVLRHLPAPDGTRSRPVELDEVPQVVIHAFLAAEDRRFFEHAGYDPRAMVRACRDGLRAGRVVSGASTITQQLVRISRPRPRTAATKLAELAAAVKLEHLLDKRTILRHYLNRVPLGCNVHGIGLAARLYFDCDVSRLDASRAALLAALPQAPARIFGRPGARAALERRRQWILRRMVACGWLDADEAELARKERPGPRRPRHPFTAPHAVGQALTEARRRGGSVATTLDAGLQDVLERIIRSRRLELQDRKCTQMAAIVVEVGTREILALVGSYGARTPLGWNDGTRARRSAGSTLKPFAYALALERGFSPASMLRDTRRVFAAPRSDYRPLNFDRTEQGPVSMRRALAGSLNLPAVHMAKELGVAPIFERLGLLGLAPLVDDPEHYGLGIVIGNMEVRLQDLAAAYAALADGGTYRPLRLLRDGAAGAERRVFSPQAAWIILDMLADPAARSTEFGAPWFLDYPWPVAMKTGTSTAFRDCWMAAVTSRHVILVWAGNFDGSSTDSLTGARACGPVVHDLLEHLAGRYGDPGAFPEPEGVERRRVCAVSGCRPGPACPHDIDEFFPSDAAPGELCPVHRDEAPDLVYLPAPFAPWLATQRGRGLGARFRLDDPQAPSPLTGVALTSPPTGPVSIEAFSLPVSPWPEGAPRIEITSPLRVDRYVLDPTRPSSEQRLRFHVEVSRPVERITWYVDGVELAAAGPPYGAEWPLQRGVHRIVAVCPDGTADAVTLTVE